MPKYFLGTEIIKQSNKIFVNGKSAHHMMHVLRFKLEQKTVFCDSSNSIDFYCIYEGNNKNGIMCFNILNNLPCENELPYFITLYQSLISADKFDLAIQKSVELGIGRIIPIYTKHSSVKQSGIGVKNERYQRIVENTAEQSMRDIIPEVLPLLKLENAIQFLENESLILVAYEKEKLFTISQAVRDKKKFSSTADDLKNISIFIGPEGGFDGSEIERLKGIGATVVTLGRRILRAETAGPTAIVQLQCALGAEAL